jgi:murein L,D-transpeptidase YafK
MKNSIRRLGLAAAIALLLSPAEAQRLGPVSDSGPEASLSKIFDDIDRNRLSSALERTEALLKIYPTFRLAHMIEGDLLLTRAGRVGGFGAGIPRDKAADLRDEAIVRLKAYRDKPATHAMPRYLMQMQADQKYAIVVDTKRSRLYLYENTRGRPHFVADYYITHGKEGSDKLREGDGKTPVGVYHVTSSVPRNKLTDYYGIGAFPLNYPNEWDKLKGRSGHGIWLHGVPSNTLSRPPRASDGCVVLANGDLNAVASKLQIGLTPVIISDQIEWLSLDDWQKERGALRREIETWRQDWESGNTDQYLRHYARDFKSDNATRTQWASYKRSVATDKHWVKVKISNIGMFRSPGKEELVVVTFDQDYRSNNHSQTAQKRQYWIKENGQWKIFYEGLA